MCGCHFIAVGIRLTISDLHVGKLPGRASNTFLQQKSAAWIFNHLVVPIRLSYGKPKWEKKMP